MDSSFFVYYKELLLKNINIWKKIIVHDKIKKRRYRVRGIT